MMKRFSKSSETGINKSSGIVYIPAILLLIIIICFSFYQNTVYINSLEHKVISDMAIYYNSAQSITKAGHYRPIGYPLTLYLVFKIFGASPKVAYLFNAFLFAFSIVLIFYIALKLSGLVAGLIGSFLFAFSLESLVLTGLMLTETLQSMLYLLLIAITIRTSKNNFSIFNSIALGIVLSLAALTKSVLILLIFPTIMCLSIADICNSTFRKTLMKWGVSFAIMLGVILGYGTFNLVAHKNFVPFSSNGPKNLYVGNNPKADGLHSGAIKQINFPPGTTAKEMEKVYIRKAFEFRKKFPEKVKQLNLIRLVNWWTIDANQDGIFKMVKAGRKIESLFLISSKTLLYWGLPCVFLFFILSVGQLRSIESKRNKILQITLISCTLFLLMIYILTYNILGRNKAITLYFFLFILCGLISIIEIGFLLTMKDSNILKTITRLSIPIGIIVFSAIYILFFFVKIRFRFPLISFYCIIIGICSYDLFNFLVVSLPFGRKIQET